MTRAGWTCMANDDRRPFLSNVLLSQRELFVELLCRDPPYCFLPTPVSVLTCRLSSGCDLVARLPGYPGRHGSSDGCARACCPQAPFTAWLFVAQRWAETLATLAW